MAELTSDSPRPRTAQHPFREPDHVAQVPNLTAKAISNKGFSVLEVISQCPTYYGKYNKTPSTVQMLNEQNEFSVNVNKAKRMTPEELENKLIVGELFNQPDKEYTDQYAKIEQACCQE